jgi:hypothetical protein
MFVREGPLRNLDADTIADMRPAGTGAATAAARKPAQAASDAVVKAARMRAGGVGNLAVVAVHLNWGEAAAAAAESSVWPGGSWPGHGPGTGPGGALRRSATWWTGRSSSSSSSSSSSGGGSTGLRRSAVSWLGRAGGRAEPAAWRGVSTPSGGSICSSGRSTPICDADRCGSSPAAASTGGGSEASEQRTDDGDATGVGDGSVGDGGSDGRRSASGGSTRTGGGSQRGAGPPPGSRPGGVSATESVRRSQSSRGP